MIMKVKMAKTPSIRPQIQSDIKLISVYVPNQL